MTALKPMERRYVETLMEHPEWPKTISLRAAGYRCKDDSLRKQSWRLMKKPTIIAAIKEVGLEALAGMVPQAVSALGGVIATPKHRDHLKAVTTLLDRTGLHEVRESHQTVTHQFDRQDLIMRIAALIERNNVALTLPQITLPAPTPLLTAVAADESEDRDE